jgi:hypothetical protein
MTLHDVQPADCFVRATQLAQEIELVRREMGRPAESRPPVTVTGASPRECWFQALAVFRKVDRLCAEMAGDPPASVPHAPALTELKPGHVLQVIDAAMREIAEVKRALAIPEKTDTPARDTSRTPSDVYGTLATLDRQINLLLTQPFTPADVFQQLSLAVAYAARLGAESVPSPFQRGKRPADCYDRLLACLELARTLVRKAGQPVIDAAPRAGDASGVVPADVYDLASLVLGEVAYVHALAKHSTPPYPFEGNSPGKKLPSHVWQLAGVLEQQLTMLGR